MNERDNTPHLLLNWLSLFYHWNSHCDLAENKMRKKLIAVDFDGVLYSLKSGWTGTTNLPDPPVEGAIKWLLSLIDMAEYNIVIFSSRCSVWKGRRAVKKWLIKQGFPKECLALISFPRKKPAGLLIDDRTICFKGKFPSLQEVKDFKPWHNRGVWGDNE